MIQAVNLTKRYGQLTAVSAVSFSIPQGEIVGLLGPNGAGKSSTIRMLTTSLRPTSGTATIAGFDVVKKAADVRRAIGFLPETAPLYGELRVEEFLRFVAKLKGVSGSELKNAIERVIESCSLEEYRHRLCSQLSKGLRQRVGLAQALIHQPPVIILDEPSSGLDPVQMVAIRKLIRSLGGKHTVILSTHLLQEVTETCSRVIMIARGSIAIEGPLAEVVKEKSLETRFLDALEIQGVGGVAA